MSPANNDSIQHRLPLKITSVALQKKRKDRYSLYHEDEFLTGVSAQAVLDHSIQKGTMLTAEIWKSIQASEELQGVRESVLRYLGRRDHSASELRRKVSAKGYDTTVIDRILSEFQEKGYIDDMAFAEKFASDKAEFKQWGPNKIKAALFKKGVKASVAEKVIQNLSVNLEHHQICVDLLRKRKQHFMRETDPLKRKQKMYRYLAGKGYASGSISRAIDQIRGEFHV
jgi:regulatory protein